MGNQRIERGTPLGLIEPGDGAGIGGIGAEPINGLSREPDQAAIGEHARRRTRGGLPSGQNLCLQTHIHQVSILDSGSCGAQNPRL